MLAESQVPVHHGSATAETVAVHAAPLAPRSSVTVTSPSVSVRDALPAAALPRSELAGTEILSEPAAMANVMLVSSANAGAELARNASDAATVMMRIECLTIPSFRVVPT